MQFDELCSSNDLPNIHKTGVEAQVQTNSQEDKCDEEENIPPSNFLSHKFKQRSLKTKFTRPRIEKSASAISSQEYEDTSECIMPACDQNLSFDDQILALFRAEEPQNKPISNFQRKGHEFTPVVNEVQPKINATNIKIRKVDSVCDWSGRISRNKDSYTKPRQYTIQRQTENSESRAMEPQVGLSSQLSTCLKDLSFCGTSERKVSVPNKFLNIQHYSNVWIVALVEEVKLQLSQVHKKVTNWMKFNANKSKNPAWLTKCTISTYQYRKKSAAPDNLKQNEKNVFLNFHSKPTEPSTCYSLRDAWIIGNDLESLCSGKSHNQWLVTSSWHGIGSDKRLQVSPLNACPPGEREFLGIHGPNIQSECHMIELLAQLKDNSFPLLPHIMGTASPSSFHQRDGTEVSTNKLAPKISEEISLNSSQQAFVERCQCWLNNPDEPGIALLHGPFGSGKTTVIVALILMILKHVQSESFNILVSANTNIAVDRILNGLVSKDFTSFARVGSVRKIDPKLLKYTIHCKSESSKDAIVELKEMIKYASPINKVLYKDELKRLQRDASDMKAAQLKDARVVGVTCHSAINAILDKRKFQMVILDECSQIIEPLSMLPIIRSKPNFLVAVGDPLQLPPVLASPSHLPQRSQHGLDRPLFTRLLSVGYPSTLLDTQYRCHPFLSGLANKLFYDGRLRDGCLASDRPCMLAGLPPLLFVDCHGKEERKFASIWNQKEVTLCVDMAKKLIDAGINADDIGVICLFREQASQIKKAINLALGAEDETKSSSIMVATVDSFQGNEKKIIILSTAVTSPGAFSADPKRLNVALTRAKNHLIIVGCSPALSAQSVWSRILQYIRSPNAFGQFITCGEPLPF